MINKKIVIVVPTDFTVLQHGSHVRMRDLISWISYNYENVIVYSYSNNPDIPWYKESEIRFNQLFPKVRLILEHRSKQLRILTTIKNTALALFPSKAKSILAWKIKNSTPIYESICNQQDDYFLIMNYVDSLTIINGFQFKNFIIDTIDLKFIYWAKAKRLKNYDLRVLARLRSELAVLSISPAIIAISAHENSIYKVLAPQTECFFLPRVTTSTSSTLFKKELIDFKYDLIFVGSDNKFNIDGIVSFLKNHREWVCHQRVAIVGKVCDASVVIDAVGEFELVRLLGFVDDISEIYNHTKVAISPVDGTGLKIKMIEALSYGLPVFASKHSMDGLPSGFEDAVFPIDTNLMSNVLGNVELLNKAKSAVVNYWQTFDRGTDQISLAKHLKHQIEQ